MEETKSDFGNLWIYSWAGYLKKNWVPKQNKNLKALSSNSRETVWVAGMELHIDTPPPHIATHFQSWNTAATFEHRFEH